jgi:preprotein translocase subunit SecG
MDFLIGFLTVLEVLVCLLLTLIILMQRPRQEGLGAAFGGGMMDSLAGAQTTNVLQKATTYLGGALFILSAILAILVSHQTSGAAGKKSLVPEASSTTAPAAPAAAAPSVPAASEPAKTPVAPAKTPAEPAPAASKPADTKPAAPAPTATTPPASTPAPAPAPAATPAPAAPTNVIPVPTTPPVPPPAPAPAKP